MTALRQLPFLLLLPCLVACGDVAPPAPVAQDALRPPPELVEVAIGPKELGMTVRVSQHQIDEAAAHGVPVGFVGPFAHVFVYIPKGSFVMGSPEDEAGRDASEVQHKVHIDRGFYLQQRAEARTNGMDPPADRYFFGSTKHIVATYRSADPLHAYRLATEAEWEYACRAGSTSRWWWGSRVPDDVEAYRVNPWGLIDMGAHAEWTGDRHADLPSWEVSDPMGAESGEARVIKGRDAYTPLARCAERSPSGPESSAKVRLVAPVGYGLGHYGSVQVTFRLVDEDGKDAPNQGYDLRIIAMNDRLAARVQNQDAVWVRVTKPELPITLSMVPVSYYVYAEGERDGKLVRGIEQKFHAKGDTRDQIVPVPPKDVGRFGSGVQAEPK